MTGFGAWYEEKKQEDGGGSESNSWFPDSDQLLPVFSTESMQALSFGNMKATMEAQMPKKILGMGYQQRFNAFCGLLFLSALFFALAFFVGMPAIVLRPRKFAISFTMGSLTFMGSFGILKGPMDHLKSLLDRERFVFTFMYFGSMFLTLYFTFFARGARGYLLVLSASGLQIITLLWYLVSFIPGGTAGLHYVLAAMAHLLKPVIITCGKIQAKCLGWCIARMTNFRGSPSSP